MKRLEGAYGLCVIDNTEPNKLVVARSGSPLVIGVEGVARFSLLGSQRLIVFDDAVMNECNIGAREVREILLEGLKRLEYRGYDSAGLAFISPTPNALATQINTIKTVGKVNKLVSAVSKSKAKASGRIGIAHTRWVLEG